MYEDRFSAWQAWKARRQLVGIANPGVYVLAISAEALVAQPFSWREDIVYIGMTNSAAGLKGRLQQFDNTIIGKTGHGGADRVRYKYRDYGQLCGRLFVAVAPFSCDVESHHPTDLRTMGQVAAFEYECQARFAELFGHLPEFNDKRATPKYSLTVGRGLEQP